MIHFAFFLNFFRYDNPLYVQELVNAMNWKMLMVDAVSVYFHLILFFRV